MPPVETHYRHNNHDREKIRGSHRKENLHHRNHAFIKDIEANHIYGRFANESVKYCPENTNYKWLIDLNMQHYTCQKTVTMDGRTVHGEFNEGILNTLNEPTMIFFIF